MISSNLNSVLGKLDFLSVNYDINNNSYNIPDTVL